MREAVSGRARIGEFELDLKTGELCSITEPDNKTLLREQPFRILRMLIQRGGSMVSREEIRTTLWPGSTIVDFDHSINVAIGMKISWLSGRTPIPMFSFINKPKPSTPNSENELH